MTQLRLDSEVNIANLRITLDKLKEQAQSFLAGSHRFQLSEIEVYHLKLFGLLRYYQINF